MSRDAVQDAVPDVSTIGKTTTASCRAKVEILKAVSDGFERPLIFQCCSTSVFWRKTSCNTVSGDVCSVRVASAKVQKSEGHHAATVCRARHRREYVGVFVFSPLVASADRTPASTCRPTPG